MTKQYWRQWLSEARAHPSFFIGSECHAHLIAIMEPLRMIYWAKIFENVRSVEITMSPTEFRLKCYSGPLVRQAAGLIPWRDCDRLVEELDTTGVRLIEDARSGRRGADQRFRHVSLGFIGVSLLLARYGTLSVRASDGFFAQSYVDGWPVAPPSDAPNPEELGLSLSAALDKQWFTSLPFDIEELEGAAGVFGDVPLKLNWSESDGLVSHPYRVLADGLSR